MKKRILRWLPWMVSLAACSSSSGNVAGTAHDAGAAVDGGLDGAPAGVTGSGTVVGFASPTDPGKALQGVAVCVLDHPEISCVMSDGAGQFALPGIPPGADLGLTFTKTGYYGLLAAIHSPSAAFQVQASDGHGMYTDAFEAQFFKSAGWTYPAAGQGVLHTYTSGTTGGTTCTGLAQTTFAASTGGTPVYTSPCAASVNGAGGNGPGAADPTLTATTTTGEGYFLAAPGPIDVTATHPTLTCSAAVGQWGWPSTKPGAVSATVRAGYETTVIQTCK